ncbi:hypothetical protein RhiJN_15015 [Ceratobasidium sp. AG-Ba]|nr:hypothetical protein RhiJN_15015 [Ceratobasidium sp. AG-Ba]
MELSTKPFLDEHVSEAILSFPSHSSALQYSAPVLEDLGIQCCKRNTRVDEIEHLKNWVLDGTASGMQAVTGAAGAGKTTIAYTLCQWMSESSISYVSCFCSPYGLGENSGLDVVVSLAHQLACQWPAYRWALAQELKRRTEVFTIPYLEAVHRLILSPLMRFSHILRGRIVVMIDGLQISEGSQPERSLLEALLEASMSVPIRVVCTARAGSDLYHWIKDDALRDSVTELRVDGVDGSILHVSMESDLETTCDNLPDSKTSNQELGESPIPTVESMNHTPADCSYGSDRHQLVAESSKHKSGDYNLRESENALLLALDPRASEAGETNVNRIINILACASEPLDFAILSRMTGGLDRTLVPSLAPMVYLTASQSRLGLSRQAQLMLLDQSLSGRFHLDDKRTHSSLTHWCFDYMRKTRVGNLNVPSADTNHMGASEKGKNQAAYVDGALVYACSNWVKHLRGAEPSESLWRHVSEFLSENLLDWLELMSRKLLLLHSCRMLRDLQQYISSHRSFIGDFSELRVMIHDACRFVGELITSGDRQGISEIYTSGLAHWPQHRFIYQTYSQKFHVLPRVTVLAKSETKSKKQEENSITGYQPRKQQLTGHTNWVYSVAYSPDGAYIASGSSDNTIRMWDAHTSQQVGHPLTGHTQSVWSVAYSPDGAYIASGSKDKTIRMWDAHTGQHVGHPLTGHTDSVLSVAYSPDGAYIASGSSDTTIRMWDAHTGQQVGHPLTGHTDSVLSVAYSPDGAYIASGSSDNTIRMWDAHTGQQVGHPLTGHTDSVLSVAYSPDGAYIASGSSDKTIRMWDAHTGRQVGHPLTGHTSSVRSVAYSLDGAYLASGSKDNTIRMWDAHTGQQVGHPLTGHTWSVESVAYSPDGAYIASGSWDYTIRIWDFTSLNDWPLRIYGMFFPDDGFSFDFLIIYVHTVCVVLTTDGATEVCDIDTNGWVLDKHGDRLVHIPPRVRRRFLFHRSDDEVLALDLRGVKLGDAWYENLKDYSQPDQAADHRAVTQD